MNAFHIMVRVYYEDTDAAGVVYYANYLRYMERARTEWLRAVGFEQARLFAETGLRFAVSKVEADFLAPAGLDDRLRVEVVPVSMGGASFRLRQRIVCEEREMVRATVRIACIGADFKPARIPKDILAAMKQMTESENP